LAIKFENPKEYIAELIGTMVLVATGTIIGSVWGAGMTTAFGFAITFVVLIYIAGKVCNCHFNPIITLSMFISKRISATDTLWYVLAQIIGGLVGGLFALFMMTQEFGNANVVLYGPSFGGDYVRTFEVCGAFILEFLFALVLVSVVLRATQSSKIDLKSGAIVSFAMFALIWFGSAMTRTALNPAESIADAFAMMFSGIGDARFQPIKQLWLFILAPVLGAAVGSILYLFLESGDVDIAKYAAAIKKAKPVKKEKPAEEAPAEEAPAEEAEEEASEEVSEEEASEGSAEEVSEETADEPVEEAAEEAPAEEPAEKPAEAETVADSEPVSEEKKE